MASDRMGVYVSVSDTHNHRLTYKHVDRDQYIYYYDWGPNSGTNWMMGDTIGSNYRFMETENAETFNSSSTECLVSDNRLKWRSVVNSDDDDDSVNTVSIDCL